MNPVSTHTVMVFDSASGGAIYEAELPHSLSSALSMYMPRDVQAGIEQAYRARFGVPPGGCVALRAPYGASEVTCPVEDVFVTRTTVTYSVFREVAPGRSAEDETSRRAMLVVLTDDWRCDEEAA